MKILVTGGLGYIGSHTVVELLNSGYEVTVIDNLYNSNIHVLERIEKITGKKPEFYEIDITDYNSLEKVFIRDDFDGVIHFAGYKAVGESVSIPLTYYENNVSGSINLYKLIKKFHVKSLIFSSSATVYGDSFKSPLKEEFGLGETTNPYGSTKKINEMIITDFAKTNKELSAVILRYFNPIGAHESGLLGEVPNGIPNNLVPYIARVANGSLDYLNVYGDDYDTKDGTGVRDYIHVVDLAKAHVLALKYANEHNGCEVINVGTGNGYSVLEVVHAYEKACGHKIPYHISSRRPGDIATNFADTHKAEELLGFHCQYDINDMCRDSFNFTEKNPDGIK